jgi:endonuclease YncB( thermonuclease family)
MRRSVAPSLGLLAVVLATGALALLHYLPPPAKDAGPPSPVTAAPPVAMTAPVPPAPAETAAPPPAEIAAPPPADTAAAPAAEIAAPPPGSDLPVVVVTPLAVHTVNEDQVAPPRPVALETRDGHALAARAAPTAAPAPRPAAPALQINGAARVADVVSLTVIGRSVQLFGVKPPTPNDRCAISAQMAPRNCAEVAQEALAARLRSNPAVSCRVSASQNGPATAAVCLDSTGVDLAGFLVGEGFALADYAQSRDYSGAENIARSSRRGLWRYR